MASNEELKERVVSILVGCVCIPLGLFICWLGYNMVVHTVLDAQAMNSVDYVGVIVGTMVGTSGGVLVVAGASMVKWMVEGK